MGIGRKSGTGRPGLSLNRRYTGQGASHRGNLRSMTFRPKLMQAFKAIAASAFVVAVFAFAPSTAKAHAGHSHSHATAQQTPQPDAAKHVPVTHELKTSSVSKTSPASGDCGDRGCCDNGPCTGCHGFVLVAVPHTMPPLVSRLLIIGSAPPHLGLQVYRLRRPPKSFA